MALLWDPRVRLRSLLTCNDRTEIYPQVCSNWLIPFLWVTNNWLWGLSVVCRIVGRQRKVPLLWAGNQPAPKQGLLLQVLEVRDHFSCPGDIGLLLWLLSLALVGSDSHRSAQWYDSSQAGLGGWDPQADRNKHCNFLSSVGVE